MSPTPSVVDRLVLGGRFGERPQHVSNELVAMFAEAGGQLVETAHVYAAGRAEPSVASAVRAAEFRLGVISKVGHPDGSGHSTLDPNTLRAQLAASRQRLGATRIELVMLHRDDPAQSARRLLEPLIEARDAGAFRHVGVANWGLRRMEAARGTTGSALAAVSLQHAIVVPRRAPWAGTRHADRADLRWARRHGIRLLAWSPLGGGFVLRAGGARTRSYGSERARQKVQRCARIARSLGAPVAAVALAAIMRDPVVYPVIGPESARELADALAAADLLADPGTSQLLSSLTP